MSSSPSPKWLRPVLLVGVVLLPILGGLLWKGLTGPPARVRIASGAEGGRYRELADSLAVELEHQLGIRAEVIATGGSLDNLDLLHRGEAELVLFEPGVVEDPSATADSAATTGPAATSTTAARFVATLYSQPLLFLAGTGRGIHSLDDLRGRRLCLGPTGSGDVALGRLVLEHHGLTDSDPQLVPLPYDRIAAAFAAGEIDAALVSLGLPAPLLADIAGQGLAELRPLDLADGLISRFLFLDAFTVPAGAWAGGQPPSPPGDVTTVASLAQLLIAESAPASLAEATAEIVNDPTFQRANRLDELFRGGAAFANRRPEFPLHSGAERFYGPNPRPLLPANFVEATEGMRSFLFSLVIAAWLGWRSLRRRRRLSQGHRLDRYIHQVLDIERRQLDLDQRPAGGGGGCNDANGADDDAEHLQLLLDEVTHLRQEALKEFSANELREDPAVACFIEMCHALSNKINAKLTRQRIDRLGREGAAAGVAG